MREGGVVSATPIWVDDAAWMLSESPLVRLGQWREGAETFEGIRVARHISPTEIAVIDRTREAVRVFDMTGSLVAEIGREGDGWGEFRFATHVEEMRDTIYVADQSLRRVSRFDRFGQFIDQVRLPEDFPGLMRVVGTYPSGSVLVQQPGVGSRAVVKPGALPPDT